MPHGQVRKLFRKEYVHAESLEIRLSAVGERHCESEDPWEQRMKWKILSWEHINDDVQVSQYEGGPAQSLQATLSC